MMYDYTKRGYLLPKRRRRKWAELNAYLARVLRSKASRKFLSISPLEHQVHMVIVHQYPKRELTLHVDCADTSREQTLRALFGERRILPQFDAAYSSDGVTYRVLMYPLPATALISAKLLAELLQRVYGLHTDAELFFGYTEDD